jgi:hypothetical protein
MLTAHSLHAMEACVMRTAPHRTHRCRHQPPCPSASGSDRDAAHVIATHPEQGWSLLCNGVILFDDLGELLPDGRCVGARLVAVPDLAGPLRAGAA